MKILHLTDHFFPEYSGTTTRLYNLVSRLPYPVGLFTSNRTMKGEIISQKEQRFGNVEVHRVPVVPNSLVRSIPLLRYAYVLCREPGVFIRFAEQQPFDIVHAHNSLIYGEAASKLARKFNKPFILELHALSQEYSVGVLGNIKSSYIQRVDRRLLRRCDRVITLTQSLKEWIANFYKVPHSKISVVPNGADIEQFSPGNDCRIAAEKLRHQLGINGEIVMYGGVMDRMNGTNELPKIIPQIIRDRPSVYFIFVGHGPEEKRLISFSKQYSNNVKFLPMVPYEEMPAYYQMCNVFILPRPSTISTETLIPLKLLEAMAMEKPVLGSNVGGIGEVITHGQNGYLFQKGNIDDFKNTLLEVLDADNAQIGRNARKTVVDNYTWDNSVKILQKVYEDLV